ncbi:hypothetical protein ACLVWQ_13345 [Streptomyces sp. CWNU-52B]
MTSLSTGTIAPVTIEARSLSSQAATSATSATSVTSRRASSHERHG